MSHPSRNPKAGLTGGDVAALPAKTDPGNPPRLGRRLLITRVATGAAVLAASLAPAQEAQAQFRTGLTDSDPHDSPGYGRGGNRGGGRGRTGLTDSDPSDGAGYGRGGGRSRTGLTDSDPSDGAGYGRGGSRGGGRYRTGLTDSDPSDDAGFGRGRR